MPPKEKHCRITTLRDFMNQKSVFICILRYWVAHSDPPFDKSNSAQTSPPAKDVSLLCQILHLAYRASLPDRKNRFTASSTPFAGWNRVRQISACAERKVCDHRAAGGLEKGFIEAALFRIRRPSSFERLSECGSKEGKF
jgi:hypothetical protein